LSEYHSPIPAFIRYLTAPDRDLVCSGNIVPLVTLHAPATRVANYNPSGGQKVQCQAQHAQPTPAARYADGRIVDLAGAAHHRAGWPLLALTDIQRPYRKGQIWLGRGQLPLSRNRSPSARWLSTAYEPESQKPSSTILAATEQSASPTAYVV
jgi:hypothetical protein